MINVIIRSRQEGEEFVCIIETEATCGDEVETSVMEKPGFHSKEAAEQFGARFIEHWVADRGLNGTKTDTDGKKSHVGVTH